MAMLDRFETVVPTDDLASSEARSSRQTSFPTRSLIRQVGIMICTGFGSFTAS